MPKRLPDNLVYGYHGTSSVHVSSILRDGFQRSDKPWDWLGHAAYFWEGDHDRAAEWAAVRVTEVGGGPVVLRALIDLSQCFDLTLQKYREELAQIAVAVLENLTPEALDRMRQTDQRRDLDCYVLNSLFSTVKDDGTPVFTTVRGLFREGKPLYSAGKVTSGIHNLNHIQLGVLHESAIEDIDVTYL